MLTDLMSPEQLLADWPVDAFVDRVCSGAGDLHRADAWRPWHLWIGRQDGQLVQYRTWEDLAEDRPDIYLTALKWFIFGEPLP